MTKYGQFRWGAAALCMALGPVGCDSENSDDVAPRHGQHGNGPVTFTNIADDPGAGLQYARGPSTSDAIFEAQKQGSLNGVPYTMFDFPITPEKSRGGPGVALLDYDGDGDLDMYVTNGPGRANSLFSNQRAETGQTVFVDVGTSSGAGVADQDSTGVCFGDIDNDGDEDIYVLGRVEPNRLLENQGDGSFVDITGPSGTGGGNLGHTSCSLGDVDGDGLLDIAVGNSFDWTQRFAIFVFSFAQNDPNQLFVNQGGNTFSDASDTSGIRNLRGFSDGSENQPTITWGMAMVDIDLDGDTDIVHADDQAAMVNENYIDPNTGQPGISRGFIHVLQNDGTGQFTDITPEAGTDHPGQWMGVTFGDFNCDGSMDFFGTNMGAYAFSVLPIPYTKEETNARWFLGNGDGTFSDPGLGDVVADAFGWGPSALDYDNDGDTDIIYFGSLDGAGPTITADNPGVLLSNDGCGGDFLADFTADKGALTDVDHRLRNVNGSAIGDLNGDGFPDIVSVSASDYFNAPLADYPVDYGSPYDDTAAFVPIFRPGANPGEFIWNEIPQADGGLAVELSDADNGNHSATIRTVGTVGITDDGVANRDGIGAVLLFTPRGGATSMDPVVGGSSYSSQDALAATFGMGSRKKGSVEVLWPGGTRNRLYGVQAGEDIALPEIPCDFTADWSSFGEYRECVADALEDIEDAGLVGRRMKRRLKVSAVRAYWDER